MTDGYQKSVQALIKKIQIVAIIVAVIIVAGVVFTSISKWKISKEEELTPLVSEKIVFTPPPELPEATEGTPYPPYSFCEPDSARSGATCGGLAGATTNPYGGKPPYSFSHQFGVGFIPTGLTLELNGLLRGTPTLPGKYTFGVCVTDLYEEVCKTTFLIVKPKSEQIEEQIEEQPEKVSPTVKIESASATFKDRDFLDPNQYWCIVKMSGTATLQAIKGGSGNLSFIGCFDDDIGDDQICSINKKNTHNDVANTIGSKLICPSWALYYEDECDRLPGQPATGKWSVTFGDWFYPWRGYKRTYFARVPGQSDWVWDSVTLTCQP